MRSSIAFTPAASFAVGPAPDLATSTWFIPPTPAIGSQRQVETQDPRMVETTQSGLSETTNSPWVIVINPSVALTWRI